MFLYILICTVIFSLVGFVGYLFEKSIDEDKLFNQLIRKLEEKSITHGQLAKEIEGFSVRKIKRFEKRIKQRVDYLRSICTQRYLEESFGKKADCLKTSLFVTQDVLNYSK